MIAIRDLHFSYPATPFALSVPQLTIRQGERVAIVGPSGTGKTTLLSLIAGILLPAEGSVMVGAQEITRLSDAGRRQLRARSIGFVFQDFALLDYLTARQNIVYPLRIAPHEHIDGEVRQRVEQLAAACGLSGQLDRKPAALSQGEQQRVALCRALIRRPEIILADEPTGNLDPANKSLILDLLFERVGEGGATLLVVTHDHDLLPRFDRVIDFSTFRAPPDPVRP
jgi:putative ABC transport system ATP-binding protein